MIFSRMIQHNNKVLVTIIVYKNSQRSGVITNLTSTTKNKMKKEKGTKYIIECTNHKIGPQGQAKLVTVLS